MKNMKVLVAGALLLALSSMMLAGCGGDTKTDDTKSTGTPSSSGAASDSK